MKKFLFFLLITTNVLCYGQTVQNPQADVNINNKTNITINNYRLFTPVESSDLFLIAEYTELGEYAMKSTISGNEKFFFRVVVSTNIDNGSKVGYLMITTRSSYMGIQVMGGTISFRYEELDKCIEALTYMKEKVLMRPNPPQLDCCYESLSGQGFNITNTMDKEWVLSIADALVKVKIEDLNKFIGVFTTAKESLSQQLK